MRSLSAAASRDDVEPQDVRRAGIGRAQALEDLDGGGLAGAVGPEHPEHLAPAHLEGDAVHRLDLAVALAQVAHVDRRPVVATSVAGARVMRLVPDCRVVRAATPRRSPSTRRRRAAGTRRRPCRRRGTATGARPTRPGRRRCSPSGAAGGTGTARSGAGPGRRLLVRVGGHEDRLRRAQQLVHRVVLPAGVAQLDREGQAARPRIEEATPARRRRGACPRAPRGGRIAAARRRARTRSREAGHGLTRIVPQAAPCARPLGLGAEPEVRGCRRQPAGDGVRRMA